MALASRGLSGRSLLIILLCVPVVLAGCTSSTPPTAKSLARIAAAPQPFIQAEDVDPVCHDTLHGVNLQDASIKDLEEAMAAGRITSVQLVKAYLARIEAFDRNGPKLNSVREINPNALQEAAALDAERAAGHVRGPMHGIPVMLKDNVDTNDGLHTTAGSVALAGNVPKQNATIAQRLHDAGAIILGKLNLSEFANWVGLRMPSGYSSLGGQVIAPYTMGNPSGSSSGSGVAGAMAFSAATIGTETSGSILSPSNTNSVVGLKPTMGLNSRAGIIPLAEHFDVPGPMVRHVYDAAVMENVLVGPDVQRDPATSASAGKLPLGNDYTALLSKDALQGVKLGYQASTNAIFTKDMEILKGLGATLVPLQSNQLTSASTGEEALIFNEFHYGINDYLVKEAGPGLPIDGLAPAGAMRNLNGIVVYNQQHPDQVKYGQEYIVGSDATEGQSADGQPKAMPVILASQMGADKLFSDTGVDAIIGPNAPFTGLGAAAGYPTITVPAGYNGNAPQGLSFFGRGFTEAKLLAYAYAFEQGSHARIPPTVVNPKLLDGVCNGNPPDTTNTAAGFAATVFGRELET